MPRITRTALFENVSNQSFMKPYYQLSAEEKLALPSADFQRSVELQAIENKIPLPVTLKDLVKQPEYVGFTIHPSSVTFYEVCYEGQYSGTTGSGVFYKTEEEAKRALDGALVCVEEGYGATKTRKVIPREFSVRAAYITLGKHIAFGRGVEEAIEENEAFDKLAAEIANDHYSIRQAAYDKDVLIKRKEKYLEVANGDEPVARKFWEMSEKTVWPE